MAATERLRDELRLLVLRRNLERALGDMSRRFRGAGANRTTRRFGGGGGVGTQGQDLKRCASCCRGRLDGDLWRNGCIRFGGAHDDEDAADGWLWWV